MDRAEVLRHEQLLMAVMPNQIISSYTLLNVAEHLAKTDPDLLRYAYWKLVKEGRLVRCEGGVRRGDVSM